MSSTAAISVLYAFDGLVAMTAAIVIWRRREAPGATSLSVMLLAASFWAFCDAIELHAPTVTLRQLVSQFQYFGVVAVAPCYFESAMVLAGERARLTRMLRVAVWAVPLASLVCAWTNDLHHWLWTEIASPAGGSPFATYRYGWWFWVLTVQNYLLMVAASVVLVRGAREVGRGFRFPMVTVVIATILPWLGNVAYNLKLGPWPGLNWLTLSLGVTGWLLVWVVLRGGLLDLLPQARGALIEVMTDAVIVIDHAGRISYRNRIARDMLALDELALLSVLGTPSLRVAPVEWQGLRSVELPQGRRWLDVRVGPVFDRWAALAGRIVVARDVTLQKRIEDEREELIRDLQEAIRRVTQLEGLLPVCAGCHSERDDNGGWTPMEKYITAHTPVEFSHDICPECVARLYPEIADPPAARS